MTAVRSAVFNVLFYLVMFGYVVLLTPIYLLVPQRANMAMVATLARILLGSSAGSPARGASSAA